VSDDNARWEMEDENTKMTLVMDELAQWSTTQSSPQKWKLPPCGQPISAFGSDSQKDLKMRPQDDSKLFTCFDKARGINTGVKLFSESTVLITLTAPFVFL